MNLAEAPTNASGLTMVVVAVVVLFSLIAWLGLVFLADRPRTAPREPKSAAGSSEELATSDEGRSLVEAPGGKRDSKAA